MQGHYTAANQGKSGAIAAAIRKYGFENFSVSLIHTCESREEAIALEVAEIKERGTQVHGYNITAGGDGVRGLTDEAQQRLRKSLSDALRGKPHSKAHNQAVSESLRGRKKSPEHCRSISIAKTGIKASPEARAKMSAKRRGQKLSPEHAKKIRDAVTGQRRTPEQRAKIKECAIQARGRKVLCVEYQKSFDTLLDARDWLVWKGFLKACPSAIGRACRGQVPRAYGFHWQYLEK